MNIKEATRKMNRIVPHGSSQRGAEKCCVGSSENSADRQSGSHIPSKQRGHGSRKKSRNRPCCDERLKFDHHKLQDVTAGIAELIKLPDPLSNVQLARELDEGLELYRVTCPIGVIGIIFEARPDALVQISSLCLKAETALS